MRTIVYIDGFNLYYRALQKTAYKWLDIVSLSRASLPKNCRIEAVKYYTAHVSGRLDKDAPKRQHAYLRAIETLPEVEIFTGNFLVTNRWVGLVQPAMFRPESIVRPQPEPQVAWVWKTEEKGSDVNLGVHLVRDAFQKKFDMAAVLTNDTDLVEPIRIVTREIGLPVTLLTPCAKASKSLEDIASGTRHIRPYLGPCQMPDMIEISGKAPIKKPSSW